MTNETDPEYIGLKEAQRRFGISPTTLRRAHTQRHINLKKVMGRVLVSLPELRAYINNAPRVTDFGIPKRGPGRPGRPRIHPEGEFGVEGERALAGGAA